MEKYELACNTFKIGLKKASKLFADPVKVDLILFHIFEKHDLNHYHQTKMIQNFEVWNVYLDNAELLQEISKMVKISHSL